MKKYEIREAEEGDRKYLLAWLNDQEILQWFPICNALEIEDTVNICMQYSKQQAVFTAVDEKQVVGIANLYIQTYEKYKHQCLFAIVVSKEHRGKGVGRALIEHMQKVAKEKFKIELLHLEVYDGNPAIRLYERMGFKRYGVHKKFLKQNGRYWDKILMQKTL